MSRSCEACDGHGGTTALLRLDGRCVPVRLPCDGCQGTGQTPEPPADDAAR